MAKDAYPAPIGSQPLDQNGYFVPSWTQFFQLSMVPRINASLQSVELTGDVTGKGGATFATSIAPGSVTLGKMAPLAAGSLIGNLGASAATPQAVSLASIVAAMPLFTATTPGIVPQSGGSSNNFLRADGVWGPAAGGIWGSITGTLSAQTDLNTALNGKASTAVFIGSGASHAVGLVPDAGASAGTTRFLREDATWVVPGITSGQVTGALGFTPEPELGNPGTSGYVPSKTTAGAVTWIPNGGGLGAVTGIVSVTGAATATTSTWNKCTATSANYALTLPAASAASGLMVGILIAPSSTALVTVTAAGSDKIDGSATQIMWAGESAQLYSDGTNWFKVAGKTIPMMATLGFSTNQTFAVNTNVLLTWTTIISNGAPASFTAGSALSKLAVLRPGKYQVSVTMTTNNSNSTAGLVSLKMWKNGAELKAYVFYGVSSSYSTVGGSLILDLVAGDYFQPYGKYYSGSFATSYCINDSSSPTDNFFTLMEMPIW